jgi:hypothetical protein
VPRLTFNCTLLTDLVLSSSPASEGFHHSLDYLPGAKFLGIVASHLYDIQAPAATLARFHSGAVRFGDAHPITEDGRLSYRIPAAYQYIKNQGLRPPIYLAHRLNQLGEGNRKLRRLLISDGVQLKQARHRYLVPGPSLSEVGLLTVDQSFTIKSGYDRKKLRSKDQQMYGYFALKAGTVWRFSVEIDDEEHVSPVEQALLKAKRMGRSSSSQYGRIRIERCDSYPLDQAPEAAKGEAYLYALSNLCFYDAWGHATLQPEASDLGMPEGSSIDWNRSQVRSRIYRTWNRKRNGPNADRLIIEKGSVFVVNLAEAMSAHSLANGVGAHRSEGLGQLLLNPGFLPPDNVYWPADAHEISAPTAALPILQAEELTQRQVDLSPVGPPRSNPTHAEEVMDFLRKKHRRGLERESLDQTVNQFIKDHGGKFTHITSSQWGQLRTLAKNLGEDTFLLTDWLFGKHEAEDKSLKPHGFLITGQAKRLWGGGPSSPAKILEDAILAYQDPAQQKAFLLKLATQMAKTTQQASTSQAN